MNGVQDRVGCARPEVHCIERRIDGCRSEMSSIRRPMNGTRSGIHRRRSEVHAMRRETRSLPAACGRRRQPCRGACLSDRPGAFESGHCCARAGGRRPLQSGCSASGSFNDGSLVPGMPSNDPLQPSIASDPPPQSSHSLMLSLRPKNHRFAAQQSDQIRLHIVAA